MEKAKFVVNIYELPGYVSDMKYERGKGIYFDNETIPEKFIREFIVYFCNEKVYHKTEMILIGKFTNPKSLLIANVHKIHVFSDKSAIVYIKSV